MNASAEIRHPISSEVGQFIAGVDGARLPRAVRDCCRRLLIDSAGLMVAARQTDYVRAALASAMPISGQASTAIGHPVFLSAFDAALVNGTAAHGEDFDDTFEGGPVHAGAVVVPAVLAVAEQRNLDGNRVMAGIACGTELMCRLSLVAPQAIHRACFHPTAVIGALAAAAAVAATLGLSAPQAAHALGIAASLSSGIIEYLSDGSWTKRLHAGAGAQSGVRAALLAEAGFIGPATVFEGTHGFFRAFAPSVEPDFRPLLDQLGHRWIASNIAFKPYACGTMTQPFVDCAIDAAGELASRGIPTDRIVSIVCKVGEGTVHRLWEPLALKQAPPNGYAGKFSTPYCIAVGLEDRRAGLEQFTNERVGNPRLLAIASRVSYVIDPLDEYPRKFTGHLRLALDDGTALEFSRPGMRGGVDDPLSDDAIDAKFRENVRFGGGSDTEASSLLSALTVIAEGGPVDLRAFG